MPVGGATDRFDYPVPGFSHATRDISNNRYGSLADWPAPKSPTSRGGLTMSIYEVSHCPHSCS